MSSSSSLSDRQALSITSAMGMGLGSDGAMLSEDQGALEEEQSNVLVCERLSVPTMTSPRNSLAC